MDRKQKAKELFLRGYSCSQAVAGAFHDLTGLTQEQLLKASVAFGGGFLQSGNLCGALSGAAIILGLTRGEYDIDGKKRFANEFKPLSEEFERQNGSINCCMLLENKEKNLLNADFLSATEEEYNQKPCLKYVLDCVEFVERKLKSE
jgi:C_GCAxxG_C_C family probable redox protein